MTSLCPDIEVLFIRHGESESNAFWEKNQIEPWIFDPAITEKGYQQAIALKNRIDFVPDLIISSPLKRSLLTAELVFDGIECRQIVSPLVIEALSEADDLGSLKRDLIVEFPDWDWSLVSDDFWWY